MNEEWKCNKTECSADDLGFSSGQLTKQCHVVYSRFVLALSGSVHVADRIQKN